jgi:hypothetical protein
MSLRRSAIHRRLAECEAALEPAPKSPWSDPQLVRFLEQMTAEGRGSFRQLLRDRVEREVPEDAIDTIPLAACLQLARQYTQEGLTEPQALSRAAVETPLAAGIPEW